MVKNKYFYIVEDNFYKTLTCKHNKQYIIIGPDDVQLPISYGNEEDAEYMVEELNKAYNLGKLFKKRK